MLPPRRPAGANKPAGWWPFGGETIEFYRKLNDARGCIYDIERMLPAIASRIAAAKPDEPLEIDDELNAVESLIWRHNDLLESAREIWPRENLGSTDFAELDLGPTPASLGLPLFTDDQQGARAKAQLQKIGARLKQKIALLDNVIFAMEVAEKVGAIASFALAGGVVIQAFRQGGKVVLVKTLAGMAAAQVAGQLIGEATGTVLEAAGLDDEEIAQVQDAVEIISSVLQLRRMGKLKVRPSALKPTPRVAPPKAKPDKSWKEKVRGGRSANTGQVIGQFASVDPNELRFSQTTAGGRGRAAPLRESMRNGWNGPAVDVVETPQGLVTIDNTRVAVARELGIGEIPVKVRLPSDPLPSSMLGRFGNANTWGKL